MLEAKTSLDHFLEHAGWAHADRKPVEADFSTRKFERLTRSSTQETAILMCAQPDQRTEQFVGISEVLRHMKLAAPRVYASDAANGFVLMEDFGHQRVGHLFNKGADPKEYDLMAAQLLAKLHQSFRPKMLSGIDTITYHSDLFVEQLDPFLEYYVPSVVGHEVDEKERAEFRTAWRSVLKPLDEMPSTLLLRDFIPDNMMSLPAPVLGQDYGLIDFQDAGLGAAAYDIASWCEDVRRDGALERLPDFVHNYCSCFYEADEVTTLSAAQIYAAQRHTRILGNLIKLDKMIFVPRVMNAVQTLLRVSPLEPVRLWFVKNDMFKI